MGNNYAKGAINSLAEASTKRRDVFANLPREGIHPGCVRMRCCATGTSPYAIQDRCRYVSPTRPCSSGDQAVYMLEATWQLDSHMDSHEFGNVSAQQCLPGKQDTGMK